MPRPSLERSYATRLRRSAVSRLEDTEDRGLAEVLEQVARRRGARRSHTRSAPTGGTAGPGEVLSVEPVGSTVRILRVGRPVGWSFDAGQYAKLGVPGLRSGSFSIASAPHEPFVEFCIEVIPGGRLTPTLFTLAPGDRVELGSRAKGAMTLDAAATHHLFVATVTGIAPLRSIVRDAVQRGLTGEFTVLHGASHADELPYRGEFAELAESHPHVRYLPTVSRPEIARNAAWPHDTGRVDPLAERVAAALDPGTTRVYAAGNSGMVADVVRSLGGRGFRISTEAFD